MWIVWPHDNAIGVVGLLGGHRRADDVHRVTGARRRRRGHRRLLELLCGMVLLGHRGTLIQQTDVRARRQAPSAASSDHFLRRRPLWGSGSTRQG